MIKFQTMAASVAAGVALVVGVVATGCGGGGSNNSGPTVSGSVKTYASATTAPAIAEAVKKIETAVGASSTSGAYKIFSTSTAFSTGIAEMVLVDRAAGHPLDLSEMMAGWRANPATRVATATDTLVTDLNAAIAVAKANPGDSKSALLRAFDLLDRELNPTLTQVTAASKVDPMSGRLIAIWMIDKYGLADPRVAAGTRGDAECQACIDAHNAACKATYDSQVAATERWRQQNLDAIDQAAHLTEAQKADCRTRVNHDCNEENFNHSKQLQTCQNGAADACKAACEHNQG